MKKKLLFLVGFYYKLEKIRSSIEALQITHAGSKDAYFDGEANFECRQGSGLSKK